MRKVLTVGIALSFVILAAGASLATGNLGTNECASDSDGNHLEQTATRISESQIDVSWKDYCSNEDDFHVLRSTDNFVTPGVDIAQVAGSPANEAGANKSYSDMGLGCGVTRYYRIRANKHASPGGAHTGGNSQFSDSATVGATTNPNAPTALNVAANADNTKLDLSWTDNSACETDFHIDRWNVVTEMWEEVGTVAADTTNFQDSGLTCSTTYDYRVRAHEHTNGASSTYALGQGTTGVCTSSNSGKDAPAVANEYLKTLSSAQLNACMTNQGTNKNKSNWHGMLISKIAQEYEGNTNGWTDEDVQSDVDYLCTNLGATLPQP